MLDPSRFSLDASTVGFRKRMGLSVPMDAFKNALQTQTESIKVRRELKETPITEIHVMGGQLYGIANDEKTKTYARQQRQINGYVLRSFQANGGPIILPPKHGEGLMATPMNVGLTQYGGYNSVVGSYVSSFTEPLEAPLDNNTILLGRAGIAAQNESASNPYKKLQFMLNMQSTQAQINDNQAAFLESRQYNKQSDTAKALREFENEVYSGSKRKALNQQIQQGQPQQQQQPFAAFAPQDLPSIFKKKQLIQQELLSSGRKKLKSTSSNDPFAELVREDLRDIDVEPIEPIDLFGSGTTSYNRQPASREEVAEYFNLREEPQQGGLESFNPFALNEIYQARLAQEKAARAAANISQVGVTQSVDGRGDNQEIATFALSKQVLAGARQTLKYEQVAAEKGGFAVSPQGGPFTPSTKSFANPETAVKIFSGGGVKSRVSGLTEAFDLPAMQQNREKEALSLSAQKAVEKSRAATREASVEEIA